MQIGGPNLHLLAQGFDGQMICFPMPNNEKKPGFCLLNLGLPERSRVPFRFQTQIPRSDDNGGEDGVPLL